MSTALADLGVQAGEYFLVSAHREENVDSPERLAALLECLNAVAGEWTLPVLVSTHPRTRKRLENVPDAAVSELADHSMSGAWIVAVFDWTMVRIGSRDCDANRFVVCVSTANAAPVSAV